MNIRYASKSLLSSLVISIALVALFSLVAIASIPDNSGLVHSCYDNKGSLRVIDPSIETCKNNEKVLSLASSASQPNGTSSALISLNDDGTLNTAASRGVNDIKIVNYLNPDTTPQETYSVCFNLSVPAFWGSSSGGGYMFVSTSSIATDVARVNDLCGEGYNAVTNGFGSPSVGGQPYSATRYIFWN